MRYDICQNNPQRRFGNFDNSNDYFRSLFDSKNSTRLFETRMVYLSYRRLFFFSRRTLKTKLKIYIELHFSLVSKHELYLNFDFLSNFLFRRRSLIFTLLLEINFHHSLSRIHTNDKSCLLINKKRKKRT